MIIGPDRDRGILTTDDRDYLNGRKNYSDGSERNTRKRIRDRTRDSLYDFEYLSTKLASEDVTQLVTEDGTTNEQIFHAAEHAVAFLFKLCQQTPDTRSYTTDDRFRDIIQNGIEIALSDKETVLDFKLNLQYGLPREARAQIHRKLQQGDSLTLAELREALNNNYLDDSFQFRPLDKDGHPKNVDPEALLSHDDYTSND